MRQAFALIVSIALGLLAVFAMKNYINQEKKASSHQEDMVDVLFSKSQLPTNWVIQKSDLEVKSLPSSSVSADMVKPHENIEIVGKAIQREINRGGPLFHSDFLEARRDQMLGVSSGRRLVSVSVNQVSGVSGLIHPGQRVDILYTEIGNIANKGGQQMSTSTSLLLENVSVHAIDSQTIDIPTSLDKRTRSYSTLTLSVTPIEAALLTNASRQGSLTFMIRSKDDFSKSSFPKAIDSANWEDLAKQANAERWKTTPTEPN